MKKILFPVLILLQIFSIIKAGVHFSSIETCYKLNDCADFGGKKAGCRLEPGASAATGSGGNVKGGAPCANCYALNDTNTLFISTGQPCGAPKARGNPEDE